MFGNWSEVTLIEGCVIEFAAETGATYTAFLIQGNVSKFDSLRDFIQALLVRFNRKTLLKIFDQIEL